MWKILLIVGLCLLLATMARTQLVHQWRAWQHRRKMRAVTECIRSQLKAVASQIEYKFLTTSCTVENNKDWQILAAMTPEHLESMLCAAVMSMTRALAEQKRIYGAMFQSMLGLSLEERHPAYLRGIARRIWRTWLTTGSDEPGKRPRNEFQVIEDLNVQCLAFDLIVDEALSALEPKN